MKKKELIIYFIIHVIMFLILWPILDYLWTYIDKTIYEFNISKYITTSIVYASICTMIIYFVRKKK